MNPDSNQKRIAFGYNREYNNIVINKGQAIIVDAIYTQYRNGYGIAIIKDILEKAGIPSPQNKRTWGKQTISNILSNPHYTGIDGYPQIITQEAFSEVQKIKVERSTH